MQNIKTESYIEEFNIVEYLICSNYKTRGVDAFSLALIKSERQIRKIFTFLVYQSSFFNKKNSNEIIKIISQNDFLYSRHFIVGINLLLEKNIEILYGDNYKDDLKTFTEINKIRNKIFHGQITGKSLSSLNMIKMTKHIQLWCINFSLCFQNEIGYDGFYRNSLQKSTKKILLKEKIESIEDLKKIIEHMTKKTSANSGLAQLGF